MKTAAEPGAIVVLSRMYSAGLTINCADAMVMATSWARTTLAMDITMRANFTSERKLEASSRMKWADFERGMTDESRKDEARRWCALIDSYERKA